jgi:hypothetical protein
MYDRMPWMFGSTSENFCRVYNNILSDEKCDYFVNKFEAHKELQEVQNNSKGKTLTMMNLMNSKDTPFREDLNFIGDTLMESVELYKKDVNLKSFQFPDKFGVEAFKIKRYLSDTTDEFPPHIDVSNYKNARRFLVMFLYLTDNEGGETEVNFGGSVFVSHCRKGSVLLFPPMWPWVHEGKAPINGSKYIMGSYLHYV